ncbi:MAG TPA: DNA internalization-related competence protein ComEC/Rec2 [Ruminiclostridium sp.]|jgi:competence protein ComEC|nr:DNA internalization-related competence protein ComEC/Rec2 [Clostridiaceae bacterium]HAA24714.1 DNA internalization-related competence protein ComEC/Rec2 [Ruminiclostridium sp.]
MKRPALHAAIALIAGIAVSWYIKQVVVVVLVFFILIVLYFYSVKKEIRAFRNLLLWNVFFLLGYVNFAARYTFMLMPVRQHYDAEVIVRGYICDYYRADDKKSVINLFAESAEKDGMNVNIRRNIRINVYNAKNDNDFRPGRHVQISAVLNKPARARNPGGFDYAAYLFSKRFAAYASVDADDIFFSKEMKRLPVKTFSVNARNYINGALYNTLSAEKAALMSAMLTGSKDSLDVNIENAFRASGLMHLLAVSGTHIAFLLFPVLWLFRALGFNRRAAAIASIPLIIVYCVITGFTASVLRASIMAVIVLVGKILDRKAELINSIAIASLLILIVNPFMLFDSGFQLSVGAASGLGILYKRVFGCIPDKTPLFIRKAVSGTIAAQAGILPVIARYFSKLSVISVLSNLFVVPLTGAAMVFGFIVVILYGIYDMLAVYAGFVLQSILHVILVVADTFASIPWAEIHAHHWRLSWCVIYYAFLVVSGVYGLAFFIRYRKGVAAAAFVIGAVLVIQGFVPGNLKLVFIDVGQGDSALIRSPEGKYILVDGGGSYSEKETGYTGRQVLIPVLMHEGVSRLDHVIVSHAHADHMSGVLTLIGLFPVKSVGLPFYSGVYEDFSELINACNEKNIEIRLYKRGDTVRIDSKTEFIIMNPDEDINYKGNLNNSSLSGMLCYKQFRVLFTGDIEGEVEYSFLSGNDEVDCSVLKVAHHGGKNSTSDQFLKRVNPEAAVISVGSNSFGHPSREVLDRLYSAGAKVYITKKHGAVVVTGNGVKYRIKTWLKDDRFTFLFENDRLN